MQTGVILTNAGKTFYEYCKAYIRAYDEFMGKALEFQGMVAGSLNIGHQKSSEEMVIDFHSSFLKAYPNVTIKNFRQSNENFINGLISGLYDFAYIYGRELKRSYKNVKSIHVGTLYNKLLISCTNPLARRDTIHMSELKDELFILPSKSNSPCKAVEIINGCVQNGFTPQIAAHAESIVDYVLGVVQYDGVTILPYMRNMEDSNQVKYLELEGYEKEYPIHLAWNTTNTNPVLSTYLDFIQKNVPAEG